ncbi:hypothetical protein N8T08_002600 [Aspergillus melleus]|uniref:Uncharacterized protein n=1 Tax=Aspergillus melleus TaxID=138277 RepID=A0ACC3B8Z8_9EURO|nr:hypothetical protein N8T08_002600 [Aspergillus melleus]
MDCITRASLDKPSGQLSKGERDAVHACFRQGRWLWTLAGTVGMGIVLLCDEEIMAAIKGINLINCEVDALAICAFYTRPGTVELLRSLEQMVIPLMFGEIPAPLEVALQPNGSGIFGPSAMSDISTKDYDAQLEQRATEPWPQLDLESAASQKKAKFLNEIVHEGIDKLGTCQAEDLTS